MTTDQQLESHFQLAFERAHCFTPTEETQESEMEIIEENVSGVSFPEQCFMDLQAELTDLIHKPDKIVYLRIVMPPKNGKSGDVRIPIISTKIEIGSNCRAIIEFGLGACSFNFKRAHTIRGQPLLIKSCDKPTKESHTLILVDTPPHPTEFDTQEMIFRVSNTRKVIFQLVDEVEFREGSLSVCVNYLDYDTVDKK